MDTEKLLKQSTAVAQEAARSIGGTFEQGVGFTPLSTSSLNQSPEIELVQPEPATGAVNLQGALERQTQGFSEQDAFQRELEKNKSIRQGDLQDSAQDLVSKLFNRKGQVEVQTEEEDKVGLSGIQSELRDINQQILEEQEGLRREIEEIEKNREGKFAGGVQIAVDKARTESLRRQADLSVIQMGIQGRFDSAKAIADRAMAVRFERQENEINALEKIYDINKGLFDKAEQRAFEEAQFNRRMQLEMEKEKANDIKEIALAYLSEGGNSTTAQSILNSNSVGEALGKTGNIIGMTQRLQKEKLIKEINNVGNEHLEGKDRFDAEVKLSNEFNDRTADYNKASVQIGNIVSSYELALEATSRGESINAASQGVLVAFQKLLDPTSVVRESEYARSGQGLSLISRLEGQYSQLKQGGAGIKASDLREFKDTAETFLRGYEDFAIDQAQLVIRQATPYGLNTQNIIPQNVFEVMENRFVEGMNLAKVGDTFQVGSKIYQKVGENDFIEVQ